MHDLYIFGVGEFAQIAHSYFREEEIYNFKGFVVDDEFFDFSQEFYRNYAVFKFSEICLDLAADNTKVFVAVSASRMNMNRANLYNRLKAIGCSFATYVSPFSYVSKDASIGENVFIFEENVIQNGVRIGNNSILWSGNHIGHQTKVGSHVFFSSHVVVSGYCRIEDNCYFGVNSTIVDHIHVAHGTLVGAASLILKDTEVDSVYVGNPAKKIEGRDPYTVIFR
jgi:sugar O-acyltransferase (sialic acid O-acetyltransferase NeuD family)